MPQTVACARVPERPKALFTTAVWGEAYIDRFLNYSLRTQLSAGNLGDFDSRSLYLIITDAADLPRVTSSPAFRALSRLVSTECVARERIGGHRWGDKYAKLTTCQNYALKRSEDFDVIFFGYGDALWADGSYRAAARRLHEGYDAVFSFGYPVMSGPFATAMDEINASSATDATTIPPRILARHVYRYLHPMAHSNCWQNGHMGHCPSYVTWDIPGQGLLLRAFHIHPVAVRVRRDAVGFTAPFRSTLDEEFVARLNRTNPRVYVSTSSDEMGACSLAEEAGADYARCPPQSVSAGALAEFAEAHAGIVHRQLFTHSIRLIINDVREDCWREAEEEAASLVAEVRWRLNIPDCVLALEAPGAYEARWQRQMRSAHMSPYHVESDDGNDQFFGPSPFERPAPTKRLSAGLLAQRFAARIVRTASRLHITRAARVFASPLLAERQKQWWRDYLRRLTISAPPIKVPRQPRPLFDWLRFWRWLLSWLQVQA